MKWNDKENSVDETSANAFQSEHSRLKSSSGLINSRHHHPGAESMIRGVHTMFYSSQPEALRTFFREKLGFAAHDVGGGWLIFDLPEADLGVHPAEKDAPSGTPSVSFYCDDITATVAELKAKGVTFTGEPQDHGYGFVTHFHAPGDFTIQLYQPKYSKGGSQ
jgi:predicted enzyme related to lactoylglutathione lyase